MDQQHQIPLLFVKHRRCVAKRLLYFKALMVNIHALYPAQSFRTGSCLWYLPGTKKSRRTIPWLAYLVAGFHYETDKPSNSRLSKFHGPQRP